MLITRRSLLGATGLGLAAYATGVPLASASPMGPTPEAPTTPAGIEAAAEALRPPMFLFETRIPAQFRTGKDSRLSLSDEHALLTSRSLLWEHEARSILSIDELIRYAPSPFRRLDDQGYMGTVDGFAVWVYNEEPSADSLRFEFGRGLGTDTMFKFQLDFTGWRTAWVRFGYDTVGRPRRGMNQLRIVAPKRRGRLFLDQIILNTEVRPDYPTPDRQVPFVQKEYVQRANRHWLGLLAMEQALENKPIRAILPSRAERAELATIRQRFLETVRTGAKASPDHLAQMSGALTDLGIPELADPDAVGAKLKIARPGKMINANHTQIFPAEIKAELVAYIDPAPVRKVTDLMLTLAQGYDQAGARGSLRDQYGQLYLRCLVHLRDQGFADGSAQGTIHHIGYQYRGYWNSLILVEDVLTERELWDAARADAAWFMGLGRLKDATDHAGMADVLNTLLQALLGAALTRPNEAQQTGYLRALSRWCEHGYSYSPGLLGGFKPDGTIFHHMGMYAAYGRDALAGSVPVLAMLAETSFGLSARGRVVLKRALLTERLHANTEQWPLALARRHPTGVDGLRSMTIGQAAVMGTLEDKGSVDPELGAAYLRLLPEKLYSDQKRLADTIRAAGIEAESAPQETRELGYGACLVHREEELLVTVAGHNRYLWSTEVYDGSNVYGRYSTYGSVEVQSRRGEDGFITHQANGFLQPGFDWNRWPGTTARQLPFDELKADLDGQGAIEEMLLTDSAFGGGGSLGGEAGIFGMILHEHPFYDASYRNRNSVFLFGNRVVALGSDITNRDRKHPTQTTLFQNHLPTPEAAQSASWEGSITDADYEDERKLAADAYLLDTVANGFYLPKGQRLIQQRHPQTAPDQSGNSEGTEDYSVAVLDHGAAPKSGSYEYALLVDTNVAEMKAFTAAMQDDSTAPYRVLSRDRALHAVHDRESGITGLVVFKGAKKILPRPTGIPSADHILAADRPCLIMSTVIDDQLRLSVTDPDLHLYQGKDPDQYDARGNFVGRVTSYSRPWKDNQSAPSHVLVTVKGRWRLAEPSEDMGVRTSGNDTVVDVRCQHAASVPVTLTRG